MNFEQLSITAILSLVLIFFIWGKWRYDIVALMALILSSIIGIVPTNEIFSGFGHPATMTVAMVLILSYGLTKSGAVENIVKIVEPLSDKPSLHIAALIFIAAFFSMFMNNVGALALLMPIAIQSTVKAGRSPSTVLMPLSFGSILGGLVTLIGTPPNIIISTYRSEISGTPFNMFDFSPVGGIVALVGIIFMSIFGWRLVKPRKTSAGLTLFEIEPYLFEVKISQSKLKEKTIKELEKILDSFDINLTTLIHNKNHYNNPSEKHILQASDLLIIESSHEELDKFIAKYKLSLLSADNKNKGISHSPETIMSEVVITPNSNLENRLVRNLHFKNKHGINLLAISREGKSQTGRLKDVKLQIGDVLLLHGDQDNIDNALEKFDCLPLAARGVDFGKRKYGNLALAIFATTIALATFNILPIQVSLGLGVILMVVFNIIPTRELYDGVDWPVIILLGAMIPVGGALETTGTTKIIADNLLNLTQGLSIVFILAAVFIITMTLSDILNNAATAILMAPIGKTIAESAGVNTDPFLMAIAIGASCAFLTPIGHQNNALVMGPGGYKFSDYWKIGLPLEILITATAIPLILVFWPL